MKIALSEVSFTNCNENSARNFNRVTLGSLHLYFSYETVVAFSTPTTGLVVTENVWGPTTGKHLNWIDYNKSNRVPREKFVEMLDNVVLDLKVLGGKDKWVEM